MATSVTRPWAFTVQKVVRGAAAPPAGPAAGGSGPGTGASVVTMEAGVPSRPSPAAFRATKAPGSTRARTMVPVTAISRRRETVTATECVADHPRTWDP